MAIISRDDFFNKLATGAKWDAAVAFKRGNPLPIDDSSVYQSYEAAQAYASSNLAYPGQVVAVVTAEATTVYVINNTGELQEMGGNTAPMLFVADEAAMLALADVEVGQQVYREDTHTIWLFKGGEASTLDNWVESASENDTKWSGTDDKVNFYALTSAAYNGLTNKSGSTLYFITDLGKIYKGAADYTSAIEVPEVMPAVDAAVTRRIYLDTNTLELKATLNNSTWYTLYPGHITDGANWTTANSGKLATIGVIKEKIQEAIDAISLATSFDAATGKVKVGSGAEAQLTGVAHGVTYDSSALKITIPVYGQEDVVVNIPKDKFVNNVAYYEDYPEDNPTHHKVIVFTIENQEDPVIMPAEALVDIYTADNVGHDVTVTVTDDNKISAQVKVDPAATNALKSTATGLSVDVTGKLDKISNPDGAKVVITKVDGTIEESNVTIRSTGEMGSSATEVPVASLIAAAISSAVSAAQQTLTTSIAGKMSKLEGTSADAGKVAIVSADGTTVEVGELKLTELATKAELSSKIDKVTGLENNVVTFGAAGAIKDSGKKFGAAKLNATPDANTLATEAAVADAMAWETI